MLSGVTQGTVLGPLLERTTSDARLFADDCLLYRPVTVKADTDTLQRDLDALISWEDWQMAFHPEKCVFIQVTNKRNPITANYTIHGHRLDVVDSSKYLGVTISKDLRWDNHINNVTAKANKTLGFIRRNMRGCRTSQRSAAYQGLVRPTLEYACAASRQHGTPGTPSISSSLRKCKGEPHGLPLGTTMITIQVVLPR